MRASNYATPDYAFRREPTFIRLCWVCRQRPGNHSWQELTCGNFTLTDDHRQIERNYAEQGVRVHWITHSLGFVNGKFGLVCELDADDEKVVKPRRVHRRKPKELPEYIYRNAKGKFFARMQRGNVNYQGPRRATVQEAEADIPVLEIKAR